MLIRAAAIIIGIGICAVGISGMIWVLIEAGIEIMGGTE